MQYFPKEFPIRYVITVLDHTKNRFNNEYFNEARSKVLWDQLIDLLQSKPLGIEDLVQKYSSVSYTYKDTQLCSIPKLGNDSEWSKNADKYLQEILGVGRFSSGPGRAFDLGLISYKGMMDVPIFYQIANHGDDREYRFNRLGLGAWGHIYLDKDKKEANRIMDQYARVTEKSDYWRYEKMRSTKELETIELRIPYSPLWALLDQGKNYGLIPSMSEEVNIEDSDLASIDMTEYPSYISVTVVKSLSALFWEEMASLYRVANFCNNCGKVLDFSSKHKYCDAKVNPFCAQDRARKRQRKSHKKLP